MAADILAQTRNVALDNNTDHECRKALEYEKIALLRDQVFSGKHPRLKLKVQSQARSPLRVPGNGTQPLQIPNGTAAAQQTPNAKSPVQPVQSTPNPLPSIASVQKPLDTRQTLMNGDARPSIDPVLLTKSDPLLRAEIQLERQRIERFLEEQVHQKKIESRQKFANSDIIPDFDVAEVLQRAQEIVKPIAAGESTTANRIASSSESLEENTFYSSQHNDSTPDGLAENPQKQRTKPCKYFFEGSCRKGDHCNFSHDPAFKRMLQREEPQLGDADNLDNGDISNGHPDKTAKKVASRKNIEPAGAPSGESFPILKNVNRDSSPNKRHSAQMLRTRLIPSMSPEILEEPAYSPPGIPDPIRHREGNTLSHHQADFATYRPDGTRKPIRNGHANRSDYPTSPSSQNIRIVRSHITSPLAPQPARVSPLAVSKMPNVRQMDGGSHGNEAHKISAKQPRSIRQNSVVQTQPIISKKRRRDPDPDDRSRNVAPRRGVASPDVYIKDEPMSPPPITTVPRRMLRHVDSSSVVQQDMLSPYQDERNLYEPRGHGHHSRTEIYDMDTPQTPPVRRIVSGMRLRYESEEEPGRRRVVSARQPRRIMSPLPDASTYSAPQSQPLRSGQRTYQLQTPTEVAHPYRASVKPQPIAYDPVERSPSPLPPQARYTSVARDFMPMAPPPRRIVVDQYGNEYYEAPISNDRASIAPSNHRVADYPEPPIRSISHRMSVRPRVTEAYDDGRYMRDNVSPGPTSPQYARYYEAPEAVHATNRQPIYEPGRMAYKRLDDDMQNADYPRVPTTSTRQATERVIDPYARLSSTQPIERQYTFARDQLPRVQSVRPEQDRVVSLGGRRQIGRPLRQVSVVPDDGYVRAPEYAAVQKPRYQYVTDNRRGDMMEGGDELLMEEPRSAGRRPLQRM
ncbi:hypothetical protein MMC09_003623 [Bachmanniomyces sp. S44760]|nr:hypothetical protein [Bachmanniomyces sp. S44760]